MGNILNRERRNTMDEHDATETAYKNGYEQGIKDAQKAILICKVCANSDSVSCPTDRVWCKTMSRYMKETGYCSLGKRKENE